MARPKMTDAQKAAAKAAREAAKAGAPAAADRAEATSAARKGAKAAPVAAARVNSDDLDQEEKALFLNHHLPTIRKLRALLLTANSNLRGAYKKAKAEGNFTKADFDTAFAVETAENEARERAKIARQLKIAKIMGSSLGAQLDMFLAPDRTPAVDIAKEEGERDALAGKPAKPKYDPSTEQHRVYMDSWHHANAGTAAKGIRKLHPEVAKDAEQTAQAKAANEQQRAQDAKQFDKPKAENGKEKPEGDKPAPASGTPMTRAQFKKKQEDDAALAAAGGKPN